MVRVWLGLGLGWQYSIRMVMYCRYNFGVKIQILIVSSGVE